MKVHQKIKKFISGIKETKFDLTMAIQEKKRARELKRSLKSTKLKEALLEIKNKLDNKELSPFKRMLLQLKMDMISTKLDRQLAKIELQEFKQQIENIKQENYDNYLEKLAPAYYEYQDLMDKNFELENQIEDNLDNVQPFPIGVADGKSTKTYVAEPQTINTLDNKQQQLEEVARQADEKWAEIIAMRDNFNEMQRQADKVKNQKLMKYNPIVMTFGTIKTFLQRAGKTIKEWFAIQKTEKEAGKEAQRIAREESNARIRAQVAEIKNHENEAIVNSFRKDLESGISLEDQSKFVNDKIEEQNNIMANEVTKMTDEKINNVVEEEQQENKTSDDLAKELVERIQKGESVEGLTDAIIDKIKEEAQEKYEQQEKMPNEDIEDGTEEPTELSPKDELRNLVNENNLKIRTYQKHTAELEEQLAKTTDEDEIAEIKLKLAAYGNDINDQRRIRDEKLAAYREANEERPLREDEQKTLDNSVNKNMMEQILREGEKVRQQKIQEEEEAEK